MHHLLSYSSRRWFQHWSYNGGKRLDNVVCANTVDSIIVNHHAVAS